MPTRAASDALARSLRGPTARSLPPTSDTHPNWAVRPPHHPSSSPTSPPNPTNPTNLPPPAPSSSIILLSPQNRILLLHRLSTSSSFASAHVFPGGHIDPKDGTLPEVSDVRCHEDSEAYRWGGVRECFEESGILLAHESEEERGGRGGREGGVGENEGGKERGERRRRRRLLRLSSQEREEGRKSVHNGAVPFQDWLRTHNGVADLQGLIPFTRWLTPGNIPKRFSTQMYLYFLPLAGEESGARGANEAASSGAGNEGAEEEERHIIPTPDNGLEHTAAAFLYAEEWLTLALEGKIILFPPQFFLLSLLKDFLRKPPSPPPQAPPPTTNTTTNTITNTSTTLFATQRNNLLQFIHSNGSPSWADKVISPDPIRIEIDKVTRKRRMVMGLASPGPELEGTGRRGDGERVVLVELEGGRVAPKGVGFRREWEVEGERGEKGKGGEKGMGMGKEKEKL